MFSLTYTPAAQWSVEHSSHAAAYKDRSYSSMQGSRGAVVHRLQFLNVVQELARADIQASIDAVGLDALAASAVLSSHPMVLGSGDAVAVRSVNSAKNKTMRSRSGNGRVPDRMGTRSQLVSRSVSHSPRLHLHRSDGVGIPRGKQSDPIPYANSNSGMNLADAHEVEVRGSPGLAVRRMSNSVVDLSDQELRALRELVAGGTSVVGAHSASLLGVRNIAKAAAFRGDGVSKTSSPMSPNHTSSNLVTQTTQGISTKVAQPVQVSNTERPPIGPKGSLQSFGGDAVGAVPDRDSAGIPQAQSGLSSSLVDAEATQRSETPLAGSRVRRGSAVRARPRPKAAGSHAPAGGGIAAGHIMRPSDFTALDAEHRRLSQLSPSMQSPSPGLPHVKSAKAEDLIAGSTDLVSVANGTVDHLTNQHSPARGRFGDPEFVPKGVFTGQGAATESRPVSDRIPSVSAGHDSITNNASTSPRIQEQSPQRGSSGLPLFTETEPNVVGHGDGEACLLSSETCDAVTVDASAEGRHAELLIHLEGSVEAMLRDHAFIADRYSDMLPAGVSRAQLTSASESEAKPLTFRNGSMGTPNSVVNSRWNVGAEERLLELDRIQRKMAEQSKIEDGFSMGTCVSSIASPQRRRRRGCISASVIDRLLRAKAEGHAVMTHNERLWNWSATSQFSFCDRLSGAILEDMLGEIAYGEVDVLLSDYVDGLASHELSV